jgi:5-methylcytosine-specific restriction endonuclease McrA
MRPTLKAKVVRKTPLKKARRLPYDYQERLTYLFQRDRGICQLCHQPVDWGLRGASFLNLSRPSIDHVQAQAKGGAKFAVSNQQLAHLRCNQQKGVKTMAQDQALRSAQLAVLRKRAKAAPTRRPTPLSPSLAKLLRAR